MQRDDAAVSFDTRKAVALLAFIAVEDHPQSRERLAALFWPNSDEAKARSALRRTLSVASTAVGDALVVERNTIRLDATTCWSDVAVFRRCAAGTDLAALEQADGLYRGDFLAGFTLRDAPDFDDWTQFTAEGLRQLYAGVLERLIDEQVRSADLHGALDRARHWLALDPLHEPAHRALIRLYAWTGRRSAALQQFRDCVRTLDRELGVAPVVETRQLAEAVRAERLGAPPARAPTTSPKPWRGSPEAAQPVAADTPQLVGREPARAVLREVLSRTADVGHVVRVTGPVGIGRTSLLTELAGSVRERGGLVVAARCHESERGLAYGLVVDLIRATLRSRPDLNDHLDATTLAELGRLVPALGSGLVPPPLDGPGAVARLSAAVCDALVVATGAQPGRAPGVVVIDDAHCADSHSAELIAYLCRRLPELPLLLAIGDLDGDRAATSLGAALADAEAAGTATVVCLALLDRDDVGAVLGAAGGTVSPDVVDRLWRESGGLPALVASYARAVGEAAKTGSGPPGVPADVRTMLLARLADVSETTQQVLAAAAVLGGAVDIEVLQATSGRGEAETVDAVEEATRAGLLTEAPSVAPGAADYEFPYDALRRVADDRIGAGRRRLLHSRAADALLRRTRAAPSAIVARHLHKAGRFDEAARRYWQASLDERVLFAHVEALHHVEQAGALGHPAVETHIAKGELLTTLGRYPEALAAYEAAAAALDLGRSTPGDAYECSAARLAAVEHRLADLHDRLGDYDLADDHARAALDLLDAMADPDRVLLARVTANQAVIAYRKGDDGRARTLGEGALSLGTTAADPAAVTQAYDVLGMVSLRCGDLVGGEAALRESLVHARRLSDPSSAVAALNNLARLLAERGDLDHAVATADEALGIGLRHGDRHRAAALHTNLADLLHASGQHDDAMQHLKLAATMFAEIDQEPTRRPEIWKLVQW